MSREVCGICWCPYDENTGECACAPQSLPVQEPVTRLFGTLPVYDTPPQRKPLVDPAEYDDAGAAERYNRGLK